MPYTKSYNKKKKKWEVKSKKTGKVHGTHPNEKAAMEQMRAMYANMPEDEKAAMMEEKKKKAIMEM